MKPIKIKLTKMIATILLIVALPTNLSFATNEKGWVEIKCFVPDDFNYTAIQYSITNDSDNFFEGKLFKDNNFVGRMQLPYGNYFMSDSFAVNDSRYNYTIDCDPSFFEIENQDKAVLLTLTASKNQPIVIDYKETVGSVDNNILDQNTTLDTELNIETEENISTEESENPEILKEENEENEKINYVGAVIVGSIIIVLGMYILKKNRRN